MPVHGIRALPYMMPESCVVRISCQNNVHLYTVQAYSEPEPIFS